MDSAKNYIIYSLRTQCTEVSMKLFCKIFVLVCWLSSASAVAQEFVRPGVLHTKEGMATMRQLVENQAQPAYGSFLLLKNHRLAQADYTMAGPFEVIARDGEFQHTKSRMEADFSAAYLNSLMWILTGNEAHAERAFNILTAYAETLRRIPDTNDAPLLAGLEGFKIIYALEVLEHTYPGVSTEQLDSIRRMFTDIFIPVMDRFYAREAYTNGNWGPIVTRAYMAAAIHFDNREMYNKAKNFYLHARDNGTIAHYICGETGQSQESGRNQAYPQVAFGAMATICEMAWQQGDDLYSALDNRLLKGYEYVARFNLGYDVPFTQWTDITGKYNNWSRISEVNRGRFMPVFEIAYNHFVVRKGLEMPYTRRVLERIRPEGYDRDQPGFGALLFFEESKRQSVDRFP